MKAIEKAISFVPIPLLKWIEQGKEEMRFDSVVAFADVSGFTAMSQTLSEIGKEGAEILTTILNSYFSSMIARIEQGGGFVGKFGGDAITIFFPTDDKNRSKVTRTAVQTCLDLQAMMPQFRDIETKAGKFSLNMKIGIANGKVLFRVVGDDENGKEFLLAGLPLDHAADAEHLGEAGEVILSGDVVKLCGKPSQIGTQLEDGFIRLEKDIESGSTDAKPKITASHLQDLSDVQVERYIELAKPFIDRSIYRRLSLGLDSVGEIRRVSVIFLSYTGLDYDGDNEAGEKLDYLYRWVNEVALRYNGSINKVDMGDKGSKIIITFGAPTAHEFDVQHAVYCGLELTASNAQLMEWGVKKKMGIATGTVFAGEVGSAIRQEYTVMGPTVNLSARMMGHSSHGQLLVDDPTQKISELSFHFSYPSEVQFKGLSEKTAVYETLGVQTTDDSTVQSDVEPLIGRATELKQIKKAIEDVKKGSLQTLLLRGDAGIGKSRLAGEIVRLSRTEQFQIAAGEALSFGTYTPYLPWISILRRLMDLPAVGGGQSALTKIREILTSINPDLGYRLPIIAHLLGIKCPDNNITRHFDGQLRQENLFDFLLMYLQQLMEEQPLMLLFEDSQWIDQSSLELLVYLKRNLRESPLLIVMAQRPQTAEESPHFNVITGKGAVTTFDLKEFTKDETEQFLLQKLVADSIDPKLLDFMFDYGHGNPSFTTELINTLQASNQLKHIPSKSGLQVVADEDLSDIDIPDSLNGIIMSQLDRLDAQTGLTVKLAAVIGRQFSQEMVNESYPVEADSGMINAALDDLKQQELIMPGDEADLYDYIFKNLVTRDVAYDSLLFAHRREYHRRVGLCLETLHFSNLQEWSETLAHHFYHSEDSDRATQYLGSSGDKSFYIFANDSAETYYTQAIDRCPKRKDPERRYVLYSMRAKVFAVTGKLDLQKDDLEKALKLAKSCKNSEWQIDTLDEMIFRYSRINDLDQMKKTIDSARRVLKKVKYPIGSIRITSKLGRWHFLNNKHQKALEQWEICEIEAKKHKDEAGLSAALTNIGLAYRTMGDVDNAVNFYNQSLRVDRKSGNKKSEAVTMGNIGALYHRQGDPEKALAALLQAYELGRQIGSKEIQRLNLGNIATLYLRKGEREKSLDMQNEKLSVEKMMDNRRGQVYTLSNIGIWYAFEGDNDKALDYYRQSLDLIHETGLKQEEPRLTLNIGQVQHLMGRLIKARSTLEKAVELAIENDHKFAEDFARRYLGFVLLDLDELKPAEQEFAKSKEIAETLKDKAGVAAAKIGLGAIELIRTGSRTQIDAGIKEAKEARDAETAIQGMILLAKIVKKYEPLRILKDAREIAVQHERKCDLNRIDPLIESIESDEI